MESVSQSINHNKSVTTIDPTNQSINKIIEQLLVPELAPDHARDITPGMYKVPYPPPWGGKVY